MPNRSIRDERQEYGRPKVGPADPATIHAKLEERLAEREPAPPKAAAPAETPSPTKDLSLVGAAGKIRGRKSRIDEASDF